MGRILEDVSKWSINKRREYLENVYKERIGVELNLDNPQRFTEKTQWRKLYENNPTITTCINKLTFKKYIRDKIGEGYTAPLIDVWHSPDDVTAECLPERCCLKSNCSGDGRFIMLIKDKRTIEIENKMEEIQTTWFDRRLLHTNSFFSAYYPIQPCVIIEEMISEIETGVDEYKFLCFQGEPKYIYHSHDHFYGGQRKECTVSFFTLDWKNLGIKYGLHKNEENARKPVHLDEMLSISRELSKDFSFVRVDFFETDNRIYVSELTFSQGSGLTPFYPISFDLELGNCWNLNDNSH